MTPTEQLVHNERAKLIAGAFDRASTAALVVGVFGPLASVTYGLPSAPDPSLPTVWLFTMLWLTAAVWFHLLAQRMVKRLI